jgi:hypothetical protein
LLTAPPEQNRQFTIVNRQSSISIHNRHSQSATANQKIRNLQSAIRN